jgi:ABC-type antimicrobial peptide transport system permease subunit
VINEQMARKYFPAENPLSRHFTFSNPKKGDAGIEIVGVVRDGKHADLREKSEPFAYFPYVQHESLMRMNFYVRSSQDAAAIGPALRNEVRREDANLPVFEMKTFEQQIDENVFTERLVAVLSAFFGAVATLLAAIGLYGVMAYTVSRRTREIGLRMALGAARAEVLRMVMREVGLLAFIGIVVALPVALAATRLVQSQLYNVHAHDPGVFLLSAAAIALVAVVAGLIPAVAATRIDPMKALRNE